MAAETTSQPRGMHPGEALRFLWTQLTAMRTALVLLFLLALAAIPGSLLPQRPVSPIRVNDFITANPQLGPLYDRLGLFDVYASPWFAAVYLLLFVSLIGCILPRIGAYATAVRAQPPRTPARLSRMPGYRVAALPSSGALDAAESHLRARRFRVRRTEESVSAERGYLREAGNLVFHVALVFTLVGLGWGSLYGYKGTVAVVEGQAFSNTLTQFDDFTAGAAFAPSQLPPFTVWLDTFDVKFETGPVQRGAARLFEAHVRWATTGEPRPALLEVNHPLEIGGASVHLVGHGYAPVVTVRDASGHVAFAGPVIFLPQDGNFTSGGVIKVPDGRPQRLAFEGVFFPTAIVDENGGRSVFPDALNPELFLNAWTGPPRAEETGRPESVYSLDKTGLTQVTTATGQKFRMRLAVGATADLPGGGSITFDSVKRWTKFQVSSTPGLWLVLGSVLVAVAGLSVSLFVRPRRVWVKVVPDGVELAGLDRTEGRGGLDDELADLAEALGLSPDDRSTTGAAAGETDLEPDEDPDEERG
ncbi:MAG: cytochrome c biogenesis protein ResB [Micropruina sp.]|nr:MAG: cytochrome c biogenesis protein ResB [Micropruina sp.]